MAVVAPFPGVRYDAARVGRLGDVVAPPYDVISPAEQAALYDAQPVQRRPADPAARDGPRAPAAARDAARLARTRRAGRATPSPRSTSTRRRFTLRRRRARTARRRPLPAPARGLRERRRPPARAHAPGPEGRPAGAPARDRREPEPDLRPLRARRASRCATLRRDRRARRSSTWSTRAARDTRSGASPTPAAIARFQRGARARDDLHRRRPPSLRDRRSPTATSGRRRRERVGPRLPRQHGGGGPRHPADASARARRRCGIEPAALEARARASVRRASRCAPARRGRDGEIDLVLPDRRLRLRPTAAARRALARSPAGVRALDVAVLHDAHPRAAPRRRRRDARLHARRRGGDRPPSRRARPRRRSSLNPPSIGDGARGLPGGRADAARSRRTSIRSSRTASCSTWSDRRGCDERTWRRAARPIPPPRRSSASTSRCSTTASSRSSTTWAPTRTSSARRASRTATARDARSETRGLIRYLRRHRHTTPSEMVELKFHCAMPMFVARQWIRHRAANVNEYSGRYSLLPLLFYRPRAEHLQAQSADQPAGPGGRAADGALRRGGRALGAAAARRRRSTYEWLVAQDVARELARIDLPLSTYTQWYWKIDLHNLFHFLSLRADPHAQYEIRVYARVIAGMLKRVAPLSFEAWVDYELGGAHLSRAELAALQTAGATSTATALRRRVAGARVSRQGARGARALQARGRRAARQARGRARRRRTSISTSPRRAPPRSSPRAWRRPCRAPIDRERAPRRRRCGAARRPALQPRALLHGAGDLGDDLAGASGADRGFLEALVQLVGGPAPAHAARRDAGRRSICSCRRW